MAGKAARRALTEVAEDHLAEKENFVAGEKGPQKRGRPARKETAPEPLKPLNTRLPQSLMKRLKLHCVGNDITIQDFIIQILEENLQTKKKA